MQYYNHKISRKWRKYDVFGYAIYATLLQYSKTNYLLFRDIYRTQQKGCTSDDRLGSDSVGGWGSGLYGSGAAVGKTAVEHCRRIDIRMWQKRKLLIDGNNFTWQWWNQEETDVMASIGVLIEDGGVLLFYSANDEPIRTMVELDKTETNYGFREWFLCPSCGKRVALLYLKGKYFNCRKCHDLNYRSSQLSGEISYYHHQLRKICEQLGAEYNPMHEWPPGKPKGMHWKTYERLAQRYVNLHLKFRQLWLSKAARWL